MIHRLTLAWLMLMIAVLGACSPPANTLPTITPAPSAMPTAIPTETPIPTPTLSPQDIGMTITPARDRLAADGRSEMSVTVTISPSANAPDLNGSVMFFEAVGGGQFVPNSVLIINNQAVGTYRAGFSADETQVQLIASVDVARIGRVQRQATITLQNEAVAVVFAPDCGYPFLYNAQQSILPIPFTLQTSAPQLGGRYGLRFNVTNGLMSAAQTDVMTNFFTQEVISGASMAYFRMLPDQPSGASRVCVGVADKDNIPTQCTAVTWGAGATRLSDFARVDTFTAYYNEPLNRFPNTVIRLGAIGTNDPFVYWGVAYSIVWGGDTLRNARIYQADMHGMDARQPILNTECAIQRGGAGSTDAFTYFLEPSVQTPLILQWRASAVGRDAPLNFIGYTVVAHRRVQLLSAVSAIELANGAIVSFMPNRYDANFVLYVLYPDAPDSDYLDVMVRLLVPSERIDALNAVLVADENAQIIAYSGEAWRNPNIQIMLQNPQDAVHYELAEIHQQLQNSNTTPLTPIYLIGRIAKNQVRVASTTN